MSGEWHLADRNGRLGPFTLRELKETLATYPNASDIFVWREGFPEWTPAKNVAELSEQPPQFPTPQSTLGSERPTKAADAFLSKPLIAAVTAVTCIGLISLTAYYHYQYVLLDAEVEKWARQYDDQLFAECGGIERRSLTARYNEKEFRVACDQERERRECIGLEPRIITAAHTEERFRKRCKDLWGIRVRARR